MRILVDTSVWIDYFRSGVQSTPLDQLINDNLLVTNDTILAELVPYLRLKNKIKLSGYYTLSINYRLILTGPGLSHFKLNV